MNTTDEEIIAIYDADGSLAGELAYLWGKIRGSRECALCDISHGLNPMGKRDWRCAQRQPQSITWLHRDDQSEALFAYTRDKLPLVVRRCGDTFTTLLSRAELSACNGDFAAFERALAVRLSARG